MKTQHIKLKDLKVGQKIKTVDKSGQVVFKTVTDKWCSKVTEERKITFENGTTLICSNKHPIMCLIDNKIEQVLPDNLEKFHAVISESGVTNICNVDKIKSNTKYIDITVEGEHTFFAGDKDKILTHNSQGGVRGASATINFPFFHLEAEDLIVLKNNKGTAEARIRDMDYCIHLNGFFLQRVIDDGHITLFSPHETKDLQEAFYGKNQKAFEDIYEKYERSRSVTKKRIKAREYFADILTERQETGRIYIFFADNVNLHSSFKIAVKMTNLCTEITLPTNPLQFEHDPEGEIALCTLSAINWGLIHKPEDFEHVCELAVRGLDALLDYQEYPIKAAEISTMKRRPLGIGITNFAYFLAKRGLKYDKEALETVHEYAEAWSYYLIKASMELAKEKGVSCPAFDETTYSQSKFPIDTYKKTVDQLVPNTLRLDWDQLKSDVRENGMANSTLMALMPAESSAQTNNSTNGFEPPPELVTKKKSKHGTLAQVVPEMHKLKNMYDLRWNQKPQDYLMVAAVMQKFMDQSGSFNTSHNPEHYDGQIPMSVLMEDTIFAYKYGIKTMYYANPAPTVVEQEFTNSQEDDIIEQEHCEACSI